jgi:hypothetical protein
MAERAVDRWLRPRYVFAALALLVVAAVLFTPEPEPGDGAMRLTTLGHDPYAARGLYDVLARLGWRVEQRRTPFQAPLDTTAVYVILAPPIQPGATEVGTLLDAVRRGARAIVVPIPGAPIADSLGLRRSPVSVYGLDVSRPAIAEDTVASEAVLTAAQAVGSFHRYLEPVPTSEEDTAPSFPRDTITLVRVHTRNRGAMPTMMARRIGRGTVLAIADPTFLRNQNVRDGSAAVLAVRLFEWLDPARPGRIVFDEYHQGFGNDASLFATVGDAIAHTAPGRGALQLCVAGLLLLLAYGVRPIAPRARTVIERRSPLEHVGALSRAYEQIGATRLATQRLVRGLRRRHPLGATGALDDDQYLALLGTRVSALAGDAEVLRAALHRPHSAADWVAVGAAIDHIERTLTP